MEDWKYSFDKISKAGWLRQMQMDLKEKPLESIQSEWWPGETLYPALHAEDREIEPILLPDHLFTSPPRLIEWIDISQEPEEVNLKILEALQFGAESLVLNGAKSNGLFINEWLKNVVEEMIDISIQLPHSSYPSFINAIPDHILIRMWRNEDDSGNFFSKLIIDSGLLKSNLRFIYKLSGSGNWIELATTLFQLLLDDVLYLKNLGVNKLSILKSQVIQFEPDINYLKQIIQTRVIHLIWHNLFYETSESQQSKPGYLECFIRNTNHASPEQFLINSATSSLSVSLCGVHGLCIYNPESTARPAFFDRNNRNIHHLLNMESEIYSGSDPMGGSYVIDFYTRKWSESIWNKLRR
ncbi:MAG: methylmalonyl-CoA mutase family protein [Saprospiraceae bacterium]